MSNYTVVELDETTLVCHEHGTYTIKTHIPIDNMYELIMGYSPGNSLYPEINLNNDWYISIIKIDDTYTLSDERDNQ